MYVIQLIANDILWWRESQLHGRPLSKDSNDFVYIFINFYLHLHISPNLIIIQYEYESTSWIYEQKNAESLQYGKSYVFLYIILLSYSIDIASAFYI